MALTNAQLTALRAAVFGSPEAAALLSAGNAYGLRDWLNTGSTFVVWRTSVSQDEIMMNGFDWVQVDNLSVGKARIWEWLFANEARVINPSKVNVRAGIAECWKGTAAMLAVQAVVLGHCKRAALRAEQMLATGTGTDAAPGLLTFEGAISDTEAVKLVFKDDGTIWAAQG